ncbi:LAMA2 [Branchiostoma lanceolatum]|uniref:LAMA2 protein n=1 Tax=Branchiostoma lanceolatum TaxID=7740 RepID=A0A8K0EJU3_BRALA|nr:LAMA2 [Branchiostoma lanceolatum]
MFTPLLSGLLTLVSVGTAVGLDPGLVFLAESSDGRYGIDYFTADNFCTQNYGNPVKTATFDDLKLTWERGLDLCRNGWLNDGTVAQPTHFSRRGCSDRGVSRLSSHQWSEKFDVWCVVERQTQCVTINQFSCGNGLCVPNWARCDGVNNCGDNSDEQQCGGVFLYPAMSGDSAINFWSAAKSCEIVGARLARWQDLTEQWAKGLDICRSGWLQDGATARPIHKEREDCGVVGVSHDANVMWNTKHDAWCKALSNNFACESVSQYTCNNLNCVPKWAMCDGVDNCGDFSDELPDRCGKVAGKPTSDRQSPEGASKVVLLSDEQGQATINFLQAPDRCLENGMQVASWEELQDTWSAGLDLCRNGWLLDGTVAHPIHTSRENCEEVGVNHEGSHEYSEKYNVWCKASKDYDCNSIDQFSCTNGLCVPHWAHCDGVDNCGDNSDEQHCGLQGLAVHKEDAVKGLRDMHGHEYKGSVFLYPARGTPAVTFDQAEATCSAVGARVASWDDLRDTWLEGLDLCMMGWLADGTVAHPIHTGRSKCGTNINHEGSREHSEKFFVWCKPKYKTFACRDIMQETCDNGLCIPTSALCDGIDNCGDGSDEKCDGQKTSVQSKHAFLYEGNRVFDARMDQDMYDFSQAETKCAEFDAKVASLDDLRDAHEAGLDLCRQGWLDDKSTGHPIHFPREGCTEMGLNQKAPDMDMFVEFHVWCQPKTVVACDQINQFGCSSGLCIPEWARCDGINNCGDNSDESNCGHVFLYPGKENDVSGQVTFWMAEQTCAKVGARVASWEDMYNTWQLGLDICRMAWLSDATTVHPIHTARENCGDPGLIHYGQHEYSMVFDIWCQPVEEGWDCSKVDQFSCANGLCIPDYLKCDGVDNCGDNSDEKCDGSESGNQMVFLVEGEDGEQSVTFLDAPEACAKYDARVAAWEELRDTFVEGLDICRLGWMNDATVAHPIHSAREDCPDVGVVHGGSIEFSEKHDVWCTPINNNKLECETYKQFPCDNGLCVPRWALCNGINNCGDNSDEDHCRPTFLLPGTQGQYNLSFRAAEAECNKFDARVAQWEDLLQAWDKGLDICRLGWLLDGTVGFPIHNPRAQCKGGSSAKGIQHFGSQMHDSKYDVYCIFRNEDSDCNTINQFTCGNELCVPFWLKCDGVDNCGDNSDENTCGPAILDCTNGLAEEDCDLLTKLLDAMLADLQEDMGKIKPGDGTVVVAPGNAKERLEQLAQNINDMKDQIKLWSSPEMDKLGDAIKKVDEQDAKPLVRKAERVENNGESVDNNADRTKDRADDLEQQMDDLKQKMDEMKDALDKKTGSSTSDVADLEDQLREARGILREIQRRKKDNVNFKPHKEASTDEKAEADKLSTDVNDWLKQSSTGSFVKIEAELRKFTEGLDDLAQAIDQAEDKTKQADNMNRANRNRPDKDLMNDVDVKHNELKDAINDGKATRDEAKTVRDEGRSLQQALENKNVQLTAAKIAIQNKVNDLGDIPALEAKVKEAEEHAETLEDRAKAMEQLKSSGGDSSKKAVEVIDAYTSVADKINDAEAAANAARRAANDAKNLVDNGNFVVEARNSKRTSEDRENQANDQKNKVDNELKPRLEAGRQGTEAIQNGLDSGRALLSDITRKLNNLELTESVDRAKMEKADNRASRAEDTVNDIISGKYADDNNLRGRLKSVQEMEDAVGVSSSGGGTGDLGGVRANLNTVRASLQQVTNLRAELSARFTSISGSFNQVTGNLRAIQEMVKKARAKVNEIGIPMNFGRRSAGAGGGTTVQLNQPAILQRLANHKNYFTLSMEIKPTQQDGTILFLGDPTNANRGFFALELVDGRVRASTKLSGASPFFVSSRGQVSMNRWSWINVERVANRMEVTVSADREETTGGTDGSNFILLDLPAGSGLYMGGVPTGSNLHAGLQGNGFSGNIDELKFGEAPLSLWNFQAAAGMLSPGTPPDKERGVTTTFDGFYFNGETYGYTKPDPTKPVDIFGADKSIQLFVKPATEQGLIFFIGDKNYFISVELIDNRIVGKVKLGNGATPIVVQTDKTMREMMKQEFINVILTANTRLCRRQGMANGLGLIVGRDLFCEKMNAPAGDSREIGSQVYLGGLPDDQWPNEITQNFYEGCVKNLQVQRQDKQIEVTGGVIGGCPALVHELQFSNAQTSFLRMDWIIKATYQNFVATFAFKTTNPNGLMLYGKGDGEKKSWAVSMNKGNIIFAIFGDPNRGAHRVVSQRQYNDGQEHYVRVAKVGRALTMSVDDVEEPGSTMEDEILQTPELLLGGPAPDMQQLTPGNAWLVENNDHFTGCIKHLLVSYDNVKGVVVDFVNNKDRKDVSYGTCNI